MLGASIAEVITIAAVVKYNRTHCDDVKKIPTVLFLSYSNNVQSHDNKQNNSYLSGYFILRV